MAACAPRANLRSGSDVAVYRDQLDEIERDRAAGRIEDSEAAAAQVEVSRRLIAAADAQAAARRRRALGDLAPPRRGDRRARAAAARRRGALSRARLALAAGSAAGDRALRPPTRTNRSSSLIAQVETHLERNPEDGRGWEVIAPVYLRLGRFDDAVKARRNVLRLNGETAERRAALGETLVYAANGIVTAEAKAAFERAVALDQGDVKARYFLGLAAEQDGDRAQAAAIWRAHARGRAPRCAVGRVRAPRARPRRRQGRARATRRSPPPPISAPEQRDVMIRGMVERLAERLHRDGSDVEGWLRLVRSYVVLGERDKARAAVADARRALASAPDKLRRLDELVKGLGLEG